MTPTKVDIAAILTLVLLACASYFGLFRSGMNEQAELEKKAERMENLQLDHKNLEVELEHAQRKLKTLRKHAEVMSSRLTAPGDSDRFLSRMATIAGEAGVEIQLLKPGAPVKSTEEHFLPVRIEASATFARLYRFLAKLENTRQIATIEQLTLTRDIEERNCLAKMLLHLHMPPGPKEG